MENKDLITLTGISISVILGVVNLYILIKNRRNSVREHLYKEQMAFFIQLNKEFTEVSLMMDILKNNIPSKEDLTDKILSQVDEKSQKIHNLVNQYDFIIPNDIYNSIYNLINKIDDFTTTLTSLDSLKIKKEHKSYYDLYFNFLEDLREIMGVDRLSSENMNLFKK